VAGLQPTGLHLDSSRSLHLDSSRSLLSGSSRRSLLSGSSRSQLHIVESLGRVVAFIETIESRPNTLGSMTQQMKRALHRAVGEVVHVEAEEVAGAAAEEGGIVLLAHMKASRPYNDGLAIR
jgi:hypothetical protein